MLPPSHFLYRRNTTAQGTAEILVSVFCSLGLAVPFPEKARGLRLLAVPHCHTTLLPNPPHPKPPRFPFHLPVSTCRGPTATPTPLGGASPAAPLQAGGGGSGEPRRGEAPGAPRRHRAGPGTAGGGLASPHPPPPGGLDHCGGWPRSSAAPGRHYA